jgi:outer membrane protein TolC
LQYKENTSSLLELLNAEADLRTVEIEYSVQLFDFQQVVLKLLKAQGQLKSLIK